MDEDSGPAGSTLGHHPIVYAGLNDFNILPSLASNRSGILRMRRLSTWIGLACGLALLLFFYRSVLFHDEQFGFRDAAHFYYPLYYRVQAEWNAGRWPLWDASENAGMPLLGNPTAAVLYPGKLIFAALPYPWAVRIYAVVHTVLAFVGMLVLMRAWGVGRSGSAIAALAFAFGAPVLFQYSNIIFLVGAAWTPWGFLAVDRWLRLGRSWALALLAFVLAMQVLGGDPESGYVTGLCAGGYAIGLARVKARGRWKIRAGIWVPVAAVAIVAWVAITLVLAVDLPGFRPLKGEGAWGPFSRWITSGKMPVFRQAAFEGPVPGFPWVSWLPTVMSGVWGGIGLLLIARWGRRGSVEAPLVPKLAGLAAAAALGGALSAAQLAPVLEFTRISGRATDEGPHDIYPFSLEPYRVAEFAWPGVFGRRFGEPTSWIGIIPPQHEHRAWVPSLYLGGLTLLLALGSTGFRDGPPWRGWLTAIAAISLIGSFGQFASPLFAARMAPEVVKNMGFSALGTRLANLAAPLGPLDPPQSNSVRLDGYLRDGDGSPYCLMAALLPGFHTFRFPSKLLSFTALALAGLAGIGWDRVLEGRSRRLVRFALVAMGLTLAALLAVVAARGAIVARWDAIHMTSFFGPFDAKGAVDDIEIALIQGGAALAISAWLVKLARRRPELAGVLAVVVVAVDLGLANASMVRSVPQSDFERMPKVLKEIAEAERADPASGPYRVHRMPIWNPNLWRKEESNDRIRDFVRWELDTLQPKYGLLHGIEYTYTLGTAELYDFEWFFAPFPRAVKGPTAANLKVTPGEKVVVYPRRGFDLWNSRYFVLPGYPRWDDSDRGIASFLLWGVERIYPKPGAFQGEGGEARAKDWLEREDYQIYRNKDAFPRAWVVHAALFKPVVTGLTREARRETMEEILFANDPLWQDPDRPYFDARKLAWIEADEKARTELSGYLPGIPPQAGESVKVVESELSPQRVVLDVTLTRPGLVILADVFYPGWTLTVDGQDAPIVRANRLMRGAAVREGKHRLVYTYDPRTFRVGAIVSLGAIVGFTAFTAWSVWRRPRENGSTEVT